MKINWRKISIKDLAAIVTQKLSAKGIDAVLVGGACVSIYTKNRYASYDLDFVSYSPIKAISKALSELGFEKESSRHFIRKDCPFFVEFVAPPLAIGSEPVKEIGSLNTRRGKVVLLTATDCVKDRLAAYYHWNDSQALEQALMVAKSQDVNLREVNRWSGKEGYLDKYRNFLRILNKQK